MSPLSAVAPAVPAAGADPLSAVAPAVPAAGAARAIVFPKEHQRLGSLYGQIGALAYGETAFLLKTLLFHWKYV